MTKKDATRIERDSMGAMEVPAGAYYGASTARAVRNFPISGLRMPRRFLKALGAIKAAAARANADLQLLDRERAGAIARAAAEVAEGKLDGEFVVDVFQTGSGTSTNMNANEVIANRSAELLGKQRGDRDAVHPNDHVNLGQSSNDVIPTALHLGVLLAIADVLAPALEALHAELARQSRKTWEVVKIGRTHLQDATPIRLGQVFAGYASQMQLAQRRLAGATEDLSAVALGGTAVGTGVNTHPEFARRVCEIVTRDTGITIRETEHHFQAQQTLDAVVAASGAIRTIAVSLHKIANDVRFMASGPRAGIGEIVLPAVQPGSSIMPGKVNPVIAEALIQACAHALASDAAIVHAGLGGTFELNTMLPLAAHHLISSIEVLGAAASNFAEHCVRGIEPTDRGPRLVEESLAMATALVPLVGYDAAAEIAKEAARSGKTVREVAVARGDIAPAQLARALDPARMTEPG